MKHDDLAIEQQACVLDMPETFFHLFTPGMIDKMDMKLGQIAKKVNLSPISIDRTLLLKGY